MSGKSSKPSPPHQDKESTRGEETRGKPRASRRPARVHENQESETALPSSPPDRGTVQSVVEIALRIGPQRLAPRPREQPDAATRRHLRVPVAGALQPQTRQQERPTAEHYRYTLDARRPQ